MSEIRDVSEGAEKQAAGTGAPSLHRPSRTGLVTASVRAGVRQPVVVILLLAALFDDLAGNGIHSILLAATALVLALSAAREDEPAAFRVVALDAGTSSAARGVARARSAIDRGPRTILVAAALGGCFVVGGFTRYSWPATLAIAATGSAVIATAWPGPLPGATPRVDLEPAGMVAWIAVFVGLGLWELTNLLLQPSLTTDSQAHPTLSVLTDPVLGSHPGRSMGLALWLALGWFLVRR